MAARRPTTWTELAHRQDGVLARRQLLELGFDHHYVDDQVSFGRWRQVSQVVVSTSTGRLDRRQLMWAGVLHGGPDSAVGGLTALEVAGLRGWHRDAVSVLVPKSRGLEPLAGVTFVETRRPVTAWTGSTGDLPTWKVEPATLLTAAYERSTRTAFGLIAAVVQQRLTTPERLDEWILRMFPLRWAKPFRAYLTDLAGGVQSLAEHDVKRMCRSAGLQQPRRQTKRRDASGRVRYTDCEWRLPDGRTLILEVDGGFHMEAEHWTDDIDRERALVLTGAVVLRCTALQVRDEPERVAADLRRAGVPSSTESSAPGGQMWPPQADDPVA